MTSLVTVSVPSELATVSFNLYTPSVATVRSVSSQPGPPLNVPVPPTSCHVKVAPATSPSAESHASRSTCHDVGAMSNGLVLGYHVHCPGVSAPSHSSWPV